MRLKKAKERFLTALPCEKQQKGIGNKKTRPFILTLLSFWGKNIAGAVLLSSTLFLLSYQFLFPDPVIKIKKVFDSSIMTSYEIQIENRSVMDIHQLTTAFRFDEKYPVKSYYLDEPQYKTDIVLKPGFISRIRVSVGEVTTEKPFDNPIKYTSGFHAITNKLSPDSSATIYVNIDKTYKGPTEEVFPVSLKHSLRSNSYYVTYKHMPLGEFAPIAITKEGYYNFNGQNTKADNYGKIYKQRIIGPDGKEKTIALTVTEERAEMSFQN